MYINNVFEMSNYLKLYLSWIKGLESLLLYMDRAGISLGASLCKYSKSTSGVKPISLYNWILISLYNPPPHPPTPPKKNKKQES